MQLTEITKAQEIQNQLFKQFGLVKTKVDALHITHDRLKAFFNDLTDNLAYAGTLNLLADVLADNVQNATLDEPVPDEMLKSNYAMDNYYEVNLESIEGYYSVSTFFIEWDENNIVTKISYQQNY